MRAPHLALLLPLASLSALALTLPRPYKRLSRPLAESATAAFATTAAPTGAPSLEGWCEPGQSCWPSLAQWSAFNGSVGGHLIAVSPPLDACFPPQDPPRPECVSDVNNYTNSYWRAAQPGAMQSPDWEQDPITGACCFDTAKPCELGNIPPFAVAAQTDAEVAAALVFAQAHDLRVVIKSSGHEFQGRSSAGSALLIWTHALRGITTSPAFSACPGDAPAPVLTSRPGDSWGEVYGVADALGYGVVGGSEISVSSAGGYTLSGGHSWQGPAYGMAVDNVRQLTAVLANGTSVTASTCSNPDLFWALRGGGGGSFAVVTSVTYAMHAHPPAGVAGAIIAVKTLRGASSMAMTIDAILAGLPDLNSPARTGVVAAGYFFFSNFDPTWNFAAQFCFNGTVDQANAALAPLAAWVAANPLDVTLLEATITPFPSLIAWHQSWDPTSEATGGVSTLGSRLVPSAVLTNTARREGLAVNLTVMAQYVEIQGLLVAGGAVATADADSNATSITPAWRSASFHLVFGAGWALNATLEEQQSTRSAVNSLTDILRAALPDSGAYFSESDFLEPNWSDAFWGAQNYARLQAVKAVVDPTGVFQCHHCVELPPAATAAHAAGPSSMRGGGAAA